jgi:glc operon protein GlcG
MRSKPCLTLEDANKIMTACKAEAARNRWAVSIAIVDEAGFVLHLERLDGANVKTPEIATLKARTAAVSRTPTKVLEDMVKERPAMLAFPDRLPVQGGLPILYQGECVGAIGVSGVKSHEDEQIAKAGLAALTGG